MVSGFDVKHDRFDLTSIVTGIDHHLNGDVSLSHFSHDLQHLVSMLVAKKIIHLLEPVQVATEDRTSLRVREG